MDAKSAVITQDEETRLAHSDRDYRMDNIRCILIYLVIVGHLLETFQGNTATLLLYRFIYSFHMPAFLFITGCFARSRPEEFLRRRLFPYVLFQVLYLLLEHWLFQPEEHLTIQFATPFWILWYLMVLCFYSLLLPIFKTDSKLRGFLVLLICVAVALLAGFEADIGYYMSLSRALVFLPFFVAGHYYSAFSGKRWLEGRRVWIAVLSGIALFACQYLFQRFQIRAEIFHSSVGYEAQETGVRVRMLFLFCAASGIALLLAAVPDRKIPLMTDIGGKTLPIFLLHGIIIRIILRFDLFPGSASQNLLLALALAGVIAVLLSREPLYRVFRKLFY